uniref:Uncharacterized protein n=1 Tax=Arundo donax TaxID=35708 RepID=A0A0A8YYE8_ARUDO
MPEGKMTRGFSFLQYHQNKLLSSS